LEPIELRRRRRHVGIDAARGAVGFGRGAAKLIGIGDDIAETARPVLIAGRALLRWRWPIRAPERRTALAATLWLGTRWLRPRRFRLRRWIPIELAAFRRAGPDHRSVVALRDRPRSFAFALAFGAGRGPIVGRSRCTRRVARRRALQGVATAADEAV